MFVYPKSELPLLPDLLRPFILSGSVNHQFTDEDLSHPRLWSSQPLSEKEDDLVEKVINVAEHLFSGSSPSSKTVQRFSLDVEPHIRLGELLLTDRALASLQERPIFDTHGNWKRACIKDLLNPDNGRPLGTRTLLALLLAIEHAKKNEVSCNPEFKTELERFARSCLHNPQSASIFLKAHGWGGPAPESIDSIALAIGISNERVRTILRGAENTVRRQALTEIPLKSLRKAIASLASFAPFIEDEFLRNMPSTGSPAERLHPRSILDAADFFGIPTGLTRKIWNGHHFVRRQFAGANENSLYLSEGHEEIILHVQRKSLARAKRWIAWPLAEVAELQSPGDEPILAQFAVSIHQSLALVNKNWVTSNVPTKALLQTRAFVRSKVGIHLDELTQCLRNADILQKEASEETLLSVLDACRMFVCDKTTKRMDLLNNVHTDDTCYAIQQAAKNILTDNEQMHEKDLKERLQVHHTSDDVNYALAHCIEIKKSKDHHITKNDQPIVNGQQVVDYSKSLLTSLEQGKSFGDFVEQFSRRQS